MKPIVKARRRRVARILRRYAAQIVRIRPSEERHLKIKRPCDEHLCALVRNLGGIIREVANSIDA